MKTVIIGGVAGGASAAARLRRLDERAEIVMFERSGYVSFANCGLPYYIGGEIEDGDDLLLQTPESFRARFNVDVHVNAEVVAIDRANKTVTVEAAGKRSVESYDKLLLAPGASPLGGKIPGAHLPRVFSLRSVENAFAVKAFVAEKKPRSAVVVGGGYIGIEMSENLRRAGLSVTVVEFLDQILNTFDKDMTCDLRRCMEQNGVAFSLGTAVKEIREAGEGLCVVTDRGSLQTDMVVLAIGVAPDTKLAADCGLTLGVKGAITVDEAMLTSDPDIYACGDAVEVVNRVSGQPAFIALAGPANKQGRIAADNICGLGSRYGGSIGSSVVKIFDMTAAGTGLNEKQARAAGFDCESVMISAASHASYYPGAHPVVVKVVFERPTGRILGAQLTGVEGVDKRADVLAMAVREGADYHTLETAELCYAPPYSSAKDPVNMAGFVIGNVMTGKIKQFFWHELSVLPKEATLLDVRTQQEREDGFIAGSVHIPVDELRDRMKELDKSAPLYVYCHSGLRSYIACRMLMQNGFDCWNLSGGYRLYSSVKDMI